jgi:hypothetical protein
VLTALDGQGSAELVAAINTIARYAASFAAAFVKQTVSGTCPSSEEWDSSQAIADRDHA